MNNFRAETKVYDEIAEIVKEETDYEFLNGETMGSALPKVLNALLKLKARCLFYEGKLKCETRS